VDYICTNCNYTGQRKKILGGSNLVSIMLWTVVPTIYGVWELQAAAPALMSDALGALQTMQEISFGPMGVALSFPGPVYSIWRRVKKKYVCPKCGEKVMVAATRGLSKSNVGVGGDDDLSSENLKKIPFRYAKDIEEYNKRMQEENPKAVVTENKNSEKNVVVEVKESHNMDKNSW